MALQNKATEGNNPSSTCFGACGARILYSGSFLTVEKSTSLSGVSTSLSGVPPTLLTVKTLRASSIVLDDMGYKDKKEACWGIQWPQHNEHTQHPPWAEASKGHPHKLFTNAVATHVVRLATPSYMDNQFTVHISLEVAW